MLDNLPNAALRLLLHYQNTGCTRTAGQLADMLACLADSARLDKEMRDLCERASIRYFDLGRGEAE